MLPHLPQLRERVSDLNALADQVLLLAERFSKRDEAAQPDLAIKGQQWVRGARALMVAQQYSGLEAFDDCLKTSKSFMDISRYLTQDWTEYGADSNIPEGFKIFKRRFLEARALLEALQSELVSRELPVKTALSSRSRAARLIPHRTFWIAPMAPRRSSGQAA
jgi:hypothetical protein